MDDQRQNQPFTVTLFSFGYKNSAPEDVNLLLDVRFLVNPYWQEQLRPLTGLHGEVAEAVVTSAAGRTFLEMLLPMLRFLIARSRQADKPGLRWAIGCTGGHHRSVAIVEAIRERLRGEEILLEVYHRDLGKE